MKRLMFVFALLLVFTLSACQATTNVTPTNADTAVPAATVATQATESDTFS